MSIFSEQTIDGQTNQSKFAAPCKVSFKNNMGLISYDEFIGDSKFFSDIKIFGTKKVFIDRKGTKGSFILVFEKNKHRICTYPTEFGSIQISTFTHKICCNFEKSLYNIKLIYSIYVDNLHLSENKIIINVTEEYNV